MSKQDKQLIIKELFSRLPYGIMIKDVEGEVYEINIETVHLEHLIEQAKAGVVDIYLRPMSSMTEDERNEYLSVKMQETERVALAEVYRPEAISEIMDWLNKRHFDYRGLIEKGLALEAPEGMYK